MSATWTLTGTASQRSIPAYSYF